MTKQQIIMAIRIAIAIFIIAVVYDTFTTLALQHDHTMLCQSLAQTPGINYTNTGC